MCPLAVVTISDNLVNSTLELYKRIGLLMFPITFN